jgi:aminoglycoside phosphotransferase (APT) family kinase protein
MSPQQNSPEAHTALLRKFLAAVPYITPRDAELVSPRLWHPDFHAGNIYIDDQARISSIIDWQGA